MQCAGVPVAQPGGAPSKRFADTLPATAWAGGGSLTGLGGRGFESRRAFPVLLDGVGDSERRRERHPETRNGGRTVIPSEERVRNLLARGRWIASGPDLTDGRKDEKSAAAPVAQWQSASSPSDSPAARGPADRGLSTDNREVAGSIPAGHAADRKDHPPDPVDDGRGPVAQRLEHFPSPLPCPYLLAEPGRWRRVIDCHSRGRGFESRQVHCRE
jgi:hypothetical protein